jgi:hypothetical protein
MQPDKATRNRESGEGATGAAEQESAKVHAECEITNNASEITPLRNGEDSGRRLRSLAHLVAFAAPFVPSVEFILGADGHENVTSRNRSAGEAVSLRPQMR